MMRVPHPSLFLKLNRIESCALCGGRRPGRRCGRCRRPARTIGIYLIVSRCARRECGVARASPLVALCVRAGRHLPGIRISIRRATFDRLRYPPSTRHTPVRPPMYRDRHINYHRRAQRRGGRPTAARARTPSPARRRCIIATHTQ